MKLAHPPSWQRHQTLIYDYTSSTRHTQHSTDLVTHSYKKKLDYFTYKISIAVELANTALL